MIEGTVSLKAKGASYFAFTRPSAELSFNKQLVMKSKQGLFGFQRKAKHEAYFCDKCSSITFKLEEK